MFPILIRIGPLTVHTYGLMVALGFLIASYIAKREFERHALKVDGFDGLVLWLLVWGLVGARIMYFAVGGFQELKDAPLSFFRIWEGGLVYYGAILADAFFLAVYARRTGTPFVSMADAFSGPLLLGNSIGRLGCFAAGCCFGRPSNNEWPSITFTHPEALAPLNEALHPTQLYSAAGDFLLFLGALFVSRKVAARRTAASSPYRGAVFVYYLIGYGLWRFFLEFLRGDNRGIVVGEFYPSQWVSLLAVLTGFVLLIYGRYFRKI